MFVGIRSRPDWKECMWLGLWFWCVSSSRGRCLYLWRGNGNIIYVDENWFHYDVFMRPPTGSKDPVFGLSIQPSTINKVCVTWYLYVQWNDFDETCHKYSSCEWKNRKGFWDQRSRSLRLNLWEFCECISLVIGNSYEIASYIHHVSGKNWKGFSSSVVTDQSGSLGIRLLHQSLRSLSTPVSISEMCEYCMVEAYMSMVWHWVWLVWTEMLIVVTIVLLIVLGHLKGICVNKIYWV